jgi:glyoxylase-like metal-dependent hydrolase (beta-lactamase superfamily II)
MTDTRITRRTVLAGAGAMTAAALSPLGGAPAQAAAPAAGKQAPAFYRAKVGDFEVTQLVDGVFRAPMPPNFVRNVPREQALAAAEAAHMPPGMIDVPFNPVLINTGSKLVLFDTGYGQNGPPTAGQLPANLAAAGIDPKAIDIVVLTHLHPDHTNGIRAKDNSLFFPNAEIKVPSQDWAFWTSEQNAAKFDSNPMMKGYFANVKKTFAGIEKTLTMYDWGKEVVPGITSMDTSGHTPGMSSFTVQSGSAKMLIQADVTNIPELFMRNPDWHVAFDVDPEKAVVTRRKFYDMAVAEKVLISGFHFAFPSMGYAEKDGTGFRLVPVRWNPVL